MPLIFKCHLTARLLLQSFACEIVQESFNNINQTEHSAVRIRLFCFDANYTQSTYVNIASSTANAQNNHTLISLTVSYSEIN